MGPDIPDPALPGESAAVSPVILRGIGHAPAPATPARAGAVAIHTHGCKLNQADSSLLARQFSQQGCRLVDSVDEADVFVLNTCTVTATADAKARQALRAAHRRNPRAVIVATGCYSQRAAGELAGVEGVSLVIGNTEKDRLVSAVLLALDEKQRERGLAGLEEAPALAPAASVDHHDLDPGSPRGAWRSRAMLKIQEGCDQVCAYCIVPKVRGRERSVPPETLIEQINRHVAEGFQEVALTGTQLGSYGFDITGASLVELLRRILSETGVPRLRVSSLQAQEISPQLLELWQDRRLCPHFHLPLQSGSDRILKAMRRRYDASLYLEAVRLIRRSVPDAGITTDMIVGFPGEGEDEFAQSRDLAGSIGFSDIHIFPYSKRSGTSAAHFAEQVPEPAKKKRAAELKTVAQAGFLAFRREQQGRTRPVLWESRKQRNGPGVWSGLTDNYIRVYAESGRDLGNVITSACLEEVTGDRVRAQIK